MRKLIFLSAILLCSCTKKWSCDITAVTPTLNGDTSITITQTFHGTKAEKEDFENTTNGVPGSSIECH